MQTVSDQQASPDSATAGKPGPVSVRPVQTRRDLGLFINLPWSIYAGDDLWVPPLRLERRLQFSRANPFFKHGEWQAWLAFRDGRPVGRISAQTDRLHRELYGPDTGHFGLIEGIEDDDVFAALVSSAEEWLKQHGARRISGPFNMSINQECGILVDGFDTPPVMMMPHARPWYGPMLERQGYTRAVDLLAYWINTDFKAPPAMRRLLDRFSGQVSVRTLRRSELKVEMEILRDIFNDAWSDNWGFVPFTREEFAELGTSLKLLVPDEFIQIAEVDGKPAAFVAALPNLNEVLEHVNGRLLPDGLLRIAWSLWRRRIHTGRVPLMGVRKQYRNTPLGMALAFHVIDPVRHALYAREIWEIEMSWILETNSGMRSILERIGSRLYKRYRLYEKTL